MNTRAFTHALPDIMKSCIARPIFMLFFFSMTACCHAMAAAVPSAGSLILNQTGTDDSYATIFSYDDVPRDDVPRDDVDIQVDIELPVEVALDSAWPFSTSHFAQFAQFAQLAQFAQFSRLSSMDAMWPSPFGQWDVPPQLFESRLIAWLRDAPRSAWTSPVYGDEGYDDYLYDTMSIETSALLCFALATLICITCTTRRQQQAATHDVACGTDRTLLDVRSIKV